MRGLGIVKGRRRGRLKEKERGRERVQKEKGKIM